MPKFFKSSWSSSVYYILYFLLVRSSVKIQRKMWNQTVFRSIAQEIHSTAVTKSYSLWKCIPWIVKSEREFMARCKYLENADVFNFYSRNLRRKYFRMPNFYSFENPKHIFHFLCYCALKKIVSRVEPRLKERRILEQLRHEALN